MSIRRCNACHSWSHCAGYQYFDPGEVDGRWCWHQVMFLIWTREWILRFEWPQEPSDYVEQGKSQVRASAAFEGSVAVVCGEFTRRWQYFNKSWSADKDVGILDHEIAAGLGLRLLSPPARSVVEYFIKPHKMFYHDWVNQRWRRGEAPRLQKIRK